MVCRGVPKSTTIPVPMLPVLETPQVYPYPCSTINVDSPVARDVTMAVVDGIVFGPPVWLIFLAMKNT